MSYRNPFPIADDPLPPKPKTAPPQRVVTPPPAPVDPAAPSATDPVLPESTRPTVDPQQQKLYESLTQQLENTPQPTLDQAQYKAPNKTAGAIASLLGILFPGAPIAKIATGYLQGGVQSAEDAYKREQEKNQAAYAAKEQGLTDLARREQTAQSAVETQQKAGEVWDYHQATLAQRSAELQARLDRNNELANEAAQRMQSVWARIGISKANLSRLTTKDQNQIALALTHDAMTQQQASQRLAQSGQIAMLDELGRNTRFVQDHQFQSARLKVMAQDRVYQTIVTSEMNPLNPDTPEQKQAKIGAALDQLDKAYTENISPLEASHPEIAQYGDAISSSAYGTDGNYTTPSVGAPQSTANPASSYHGFGGTGGGGSTAQSTFGTTPGAKAQMPPKTMLTQLAQLWVRAGGRPEDADMMAIVAANESAGSSNAANPAGTGIGLWQINPEAHGTGDWTDPLTNAREAVKLYNQFGLKPWADSANKGAFGGWASVISARPGAAPPPGTDLAAYLAKLPDPNKPPPAAPGAPNPDNPAGPVAGALGLKLPPPTPTGGAPGGAPPAPSAAPPAAPPKPPGAGKLLPPQEFAASLQESVSRVKADPNAFNNEEAGINNAFKAGAITEQQKNQGLAALQSTRRPAAPPAPPQQAVARPPAAPPAASVPPSPAPSGGDPYATPDSMKIKLPQGPGSGPFGMMTDADIARKRQPSSLPPAQLPYAQRLLQQARAMPPAQQAAFIAKQPPQFQAYLRAQLSSAAPAALGKTG